MINKAFWGKLADNWSKDDDGIDIPDDKENEIDKVCEISDEDLSNVISDDDLDDILADLDLDF